MISRALVERIARAVVEDDRTPEERAEAAARRARGFDARVFMASLRARFSAAARTVADVIPITRALGGVRVRYAENEDPAARQRVVSKIANLLWGP